MNILDLFSGLGGFSQAFIDRGHDVITIDIEERFKPTIIANLLNLEGKDFIGRFDVVLASPPCQKFSVMTISKYWKDKRPGTEAMKSIRLVSHTLKFILDLNPRFWFLENPRGMLRNVLGKPQAFVTQCQYGRNVMKPTDLWGVFPKYFKPKSCKAGDPCHEPGGRGFSQTGLQGVGKHLDKNKHDKFMRGAIRSKIVYGLSEAICLACEKALKSTRPNE